MLHVPPGGLCVYKVTVHLDFQEWNLKLHAGAYHSFDLTIYWNALTDLGVGSLWPYLIFKVNQGLQDQEKLFSRLGHTVVLGTEWEDPQLTQKTEIHVSQINTYHTNFLSLAFIFVLVSNREELCSGS